MNVFIEQINVVGGQKKLILHLDGKLNKILTLIVCDDNAFQAQIFVKFAPKT